MGVRGCGNGWVVEVWARVCVGGGQYVGLVANVRGLYFRFRGGSESHCEGMRGGGRDAMGELAWLTLVDGKL
jgi:hypothetical protein